ncbi:MAG: hypothetical protein Q7K28_00630 [Candidatus Wildermuthbacteria bacterium]|nr:hypothetical protein [Candidatus Wildermuthbacteria bacterium]
MQKKLFFIILNLLLLLPNILLATVTNCPTSPTGAGDIYLNLKYPTFGTFSLNSSQSLSQIIAWFYYFIIGISGFAAFIMLVWGGFQYLASAGNPTQISDAKDRIKNALLGLLLILISWLILQVINPDLTILKEPFLK